MADPEKREQVIQITISNREAVFLAFEVCIGIAEKHGQTLIAREIRNVSNDFLNNGS